MVQSWIRQRRRGHWMVLMALGAGLCAVACSEGDPAPQAGQARSAAQVPVPPQPKPDPDPQGGTRAPRVSTPPRGPAPSGVPQPPTFMSTSGADATAAQVWGEVIGSNVGAAQSCGATDLQISDYLEQVRWHVALLDTRSSPSADYVRAYELSRAKSAAVARSEDACREILSAMGR